MSQNAAQSARAAAAREHPGLRPRAQPRTSPWGRDKRQRTVSLTDRAWGLLEELAAGPGFPVSEILEIVIRYSAETMPDPQDLRPTYLQKEGSLS